MLFWVIMNSIVAVFLIAGLVTFKKQRNNKGTQSTSHNNLTKLGTPSASHNSGTMDAIALCQSIAQMVHDTGGQNMEHYMTPLIDEACRIAQQHQETED